mgnify:CR=1 FL=1
MAKKTTASNAYKTPALDVATKMRVAKAWADRCQGLSRFNQWNFVIQSDDWKDAFNDHIAYCLEQMGYPRQCE